MHTDAPNVPHPGANRDRRRCQAVRRSGRLGFADARLARRPQRLVLPGHQLSARGSSGSGWLAPAAHVASRRWCPARTSAGALTALTRDGAAVVPELRVVKGITYAVFAATSGAYAATYGSGTPTGTTPPPTPGPGSPGPGTPGGYGQSTQPPAAGSGVAGTSTGSDQSPPARPKVMKHTVRVTRQGVLRLQVRCPRSEVRCRVDVRLRHGGRRVAKAAATLPGGKTMQGQAPAHEQRAGPPHA